MRSLFLRAVVPGVLAAGPAWGQSPYVHFEARHTHPIALSPDGTKLFAVNSPEARLSVFDVSHPENPVPVLIAEIPVGMEPVSVRARTDDEVWVVNELSDSVSVVSVSGRRTVATLRTGDEPADVVFARGRAFVSCARSNELRVFDATGRVGVATIPLQGIYPRALAVNAAGTRVFGAFLHSGNGTTILPKSAAPAPPPPANPALPPAPATALIVPADDPRIPYAVTNHDVFAIDTESLTVTGYHGSVGTHLFDLAVHPVTGDLWVANTEARNLTRFEPALRGHILENRLTRLTPASGAAHLFDLNPGIDYTTLPNPAAQSSALAQPSAIVMTGNGAHMWVAAFGSDRVARVEPDGTVTARVDLRPGGDSRVMRGPRGLAAQEVTGRLYVLNKLADSVSVIDSAAAALLAEVPVGSHDPMPAAVREGRGFLFDARLSGNGTVSCAGCHLDADRDGLAWDLGDPGGEMVVVSGMNLSAHDFTKRERVLHPMKGPMVTQTLRGLRSGAFSGAPFHWRGDRPTLQSFNPTYDKLMGGSTLSPEDIDALAVYLESIRHHPNPWRQIDRTAPVLHKAGSPGRGRTLFSQHVNHCAVCHTLPSGTDNNIDLMHEVGASQPVKNPPLLTVYQRDSYNPAPGGTTLSGFGLLHDGTGQGAALPTVHPYVLSELATTRDFADVTAYILTLDTGTAPAVGYDLTVTPENRADAAIAATIGTLEGQASSLYCDLVVRGVLQGRTRSFWFDAGTNWQYVGDRAGEPSVDRGALLDRMIPGDALTWMGVPPGQGRRFGGDRDDDTVPDGDEPVPATAQRVAGGTVLLAWPQHFPDWYPEFAPDPAAPWAPVTAPRVAGAGSWLLPATPGPGQRTYHRLRRTW